MERDGRMLGYHSVSAISSFSVCFPSDNVVVSNVHVIVAESQVADSRPTGVPSVRHCATGSRKECDYQIDH